MFKKLLLNTVLDGVRRYGAEGLARRWGLTARELVFMVSDTDALALAIGSRNEDNYDSQHLPTDVLEKDNGRA